MRTAAFKLSNKKPAKKIAWPQLGVLPEITHLQFLALSLIGSHNHRPGGEICDGLKAYGESRSHPAFYMLMGRMEESGLIDGEYYSHMSGNQFIRERHYSLTKLGKAVYNHVLEFYSSRHKIK